MSPCLERSLILLNPWLSYLDSDAGNRISSLNEGQMNYLKQHLTQSEQNLAISTVERMRFDLAEGHCQRCLAYSRRFWLDGEMKNTCIFEALRAYIDLREWQENYFDAVTFVEESYNLVVEAYDCVHPQVQEAAGVMISILIKKGDLYDADTKRYAQVAYGNLRDKKNGMDQKGAEIAIGAWNLADVIYRQNGDIKKAEELVREALFIRGQHYGSDHDLTGVSCELLAGILRAQKNLGNETRGLYEHSLSITLRHVGPDGANTVVGHYNISVFYLRLARIQKTAELNESSFY
jgi:tetratricopeptide (TPR) repeat protein